MKNNMRKKVSFLVYVLITIPLTGSHMGKPYERTASIDKMILDRALIDHELMKHVENELMLKSAEPLLRRENAFYRKRAREENVSLEPVGKEDFTGKLAEDL